MIVDERIITFINSLDTKNSEILEDIEREALADNVPIIRREMQSFLKVLLMVKKPMRVLEVGTAVGFSALLMSDYLPEGGHITTIENYEKRIPIARENFRRAGKEDKITLIEVERRNRTIHARMREYLYELKHREDLVTSIIPLGDGVAVSIKQGVEK